MTGGLLAVLAMLCAASAIAALIRVDRRSADERLSGLFSDPGES